MLLIAFICYMVVNLPAGYLLAFPLHMGIVGLYLAFSLGLFVAAALYAWQFYRVMRTTER